MSNFCEARPVIWMNCWRPARVFATACLALSLLVSTGCSTQQPDQQQKEREDKTRDDAAKAVERAKPEIQEAGRKLGHAADEAAREARAFADGVRQGWLEGGHRLVNINSASKSELMELPDISESTAGKIIRNRPYHDREDLLAKHVVSDEQYAKIKDIVTVQ
ncbi:MAG: helix-hairpin-helix domain-containing protein [Candidatus Acidiferrales bacterium]